MTRHILVVDDHRDSRQALAELLQVEGYEVSEARDGATALAICTLNDVDAAVVDYTLPDIDGVRLTGELRETRPNLAVIVVSSVTKYRLSGGKLAANDHANAAKNAGASAFLSKPLDIGTLLASLHAVVGRRRPRKSCG